MDASRSTISLVHRKGTGSGSGVRSGIMANGSRQPTRAGLGAVLEAAASILMMVTGAFIPGLVIALCVVVILAIAHLAS